MQIRLLVNIKATSTTAPLPHLLVVIISASSSRFVSSHIFYCNEYLFLCYQTSFCACITLASSSFSFIALLLVLTNISLCYRTSPTCITLASSSFSFIALLLVLSNIFCLHNVASNIFYCT